MKKRKPTPKHFRRRAATPRSTRYETLEARFVFDSTVVFNEIMYHPATAPLVEGDFEWVELFNQMSINMDLSGWSLQGAIQYTFPSGTVINGRSYLVVASNPTELATTGFSGALGPYDGRLGNAGEEIKLVNNSGREMNVVDYDDKGDWPAGPDGSGFSLAKLDPYSDSSAVKSWTVSRQLNGSPGVANFPSGADPGPGVVFNEIAPASGSNFWVEIVNQSSTNYQLGGASIETSAGAGSTYVFPSQTLAPGQTLLVSQVQLGFGAAKDDKLYFFSAGKDRLLDTRDVTNKVRGLAPGHGSDWLYPSVATPGTANAFDFHDEIAINEIMYHAAPQYPVSPISQTMQLLAIDASTNWRYNQTGANLGSNWAQSTHSVNNTTWFSGPGLLGYETNSTVLPIRTTLDNPLQTGPGDPFVTTTYFETEFIFNGNLASVDQLLLGHVIDDGAIFYLNGVEVLRYNMPSGAVTSGTFSSTSIESSYVGPISIPKSALVQGVNRLSVEVHQGATDSTDILFGAELFVATTDPPAGTVAYAESGEEWIELYNRSTSAVDLTGWALADAIDFTFPSGTILPAGGYLVVSNNAAALQAEYPGIAIVGNFDKSLSNSGDRIVLLAPDKNPADEVEYFDGGYWPSLADGGGSSLELRSPNADNSKADAWAASDERDAGTWHTYTLTTTATSDTGPTGVWNEFLFGMLDAGEVLIDDVSVIANPGTGSAAQLIQNGSFQADALGSSPQKWRVIGNQHGTIVADPDNPTNRVLDLRATGTTLHEGNNAGTTLAGNVTIVNGATYQISLRARWVGGSPQLNARFYLDRVGHTFVLEMPQKGGTPGAQNSTYVASVGPTYSDLSNFPIVPSPATPVTISVKAQDPDGIASMTLWYSVDGGAWNSAPMSLGANGVYSGVSPGQAAGKVVQFYVRGVDNLGVASTYPAAGPSARALYKVNDGTGPTTAIDSIRIIMLTSDVNTMFASTNLMSDEPMGATLIYNNSEIFYDVGVRLKGSSYSRRDPAWLGSFSVSFRPEQLFRGVQDSIALDSTGRTTGSTDTARHDEILIDQIMNAAGGGLASNYNDLAYIVAPRSDLSGTVILNLARYDNSYLDESYNNGSDGNLFEYELVYYQTQTVDGNPQSLKILDGGGIVGTPLQNLGSDKEKYRWNSLLKNNRAEDDYSQMIAMNQAFSLTGTAFLNAISGIIDVDQWLRTFAVANLTGVSDTFATGGNQHNIVFYVRPDDGKVLMFPWDWDESFRLSSSSNLVLGSSSLPLSKLMTSPAYAHTYYGELWDLIHTTFNTSYLSSFATNFGNLVGQSFTPDLSYISSRTSSVISKLNSTIPSVPFNITTNAGNNFTVNSASVTLTGTGWIDVREIHLNGSTQALPITWVTQNTWQVTVPLLHGANPITLNAYDFQGNLVHSDSITVTSLVPDNRLTYVGGYYSQNFDGLPTAGSTTLTGTGPLDINGALSTSGLLGWTMSNYAGSGANTEFRAHDGSLSSSDGRGVVSYGSASSTDRALGTLSTGNQISRFGTLLVNGTGQTFTSFTLTFTAEQWRRGDVTSPETLAFAYGIDAADINADGSFVSVAALNATSPNTQSTPTNVALDGNSAANQKTIAYQVTGINWAPGQTLTLRWSSLEQSGQDDGLAIDNLSFAASAGAVAGDFSGDGAVDGADFAIWQANFPKTSGAAIPTGDADGDGDADGADFVAWQTHYSPSATVAAAAAEQSSESTEVARSPSVTTAASNSAASNSANASADPPNPDGALLAASTPANHEIPPAISAQGPSPAVVNASSGDQSEPTPAVSKPLIGKGRGVESVVSTSITQIASKPQPLQAPSRPQQHSSTPVPFSLTTPAHGETSTPKITPPPKFSNVVPSGVSQKLSLIAVDQVFASNSMYRSRHFGRGSERAGQGGLFGDGSTEVA